ncbi:MAG: NAD(P)/FAD-dependent oxidoreductase [Deltaproteobacteria bacterium]|nr:NAD(P)/FAD-dependent oxidoreductase [Deltaproteobacteria bacterium]
MRHDTGRHPRIAIIGSGFGGLCMGMQLKRAGIESFTILEKSDRIGGTWRDNTYPGAACDSPSFVYCFSFEQKTDWSRKWAPQPEILAYIDHCARKYDLLRHVRFHSQVASASFDADAGVWRVRTTTGEEIEAEVLVSGTGQLNRPAYPGIPGLEDFNGTAFHSARWRPDVDLGGKRVAVIGNAASAIQFIPEIAPTVERLTIFQRSANWMIAKRDRPYRALERWLFTNVPLLARLYRWRLWAAYESRFPIFRQNAFFSALVTRHADRAMREHVTDPELRRALVPDYPIGGKRILISDDYYQTLTRDNVQVVTAPIERVRADGIVTRDGRSFPVDVIIFATGFESTSFLAPMHVEGLGRRALDEAWKDGAEAYLGVAVAGFPNFFMLYGPNTNLGHNSILFMIECQVGYVLECIRALESRQLKCLDVRPEAMRTYNEQLRRILDATVWARTGKSWYKRADGRITNNWSGTTTEYWWRTRHIDWDAYRQEPRAVEAPPRIAKVA